MGAHRLKSCMAGKAGPRPIDYICDMAKVKNIDTLSLDSSILCCNFVNTLSSWKEPGTHDYLDSYGTFLKWCRKTGAGSEDLLQKLEGSEQKGGQRQKAALKEIKACRDLLQNFLSAIANGDRPGQSALLPKIDLLLREAGSREYLEYGDGRFSLGHEEDPQELLAPLWRIIGSLKGLLIDNDPARIKECPSCGWIFLDETKNGGRIWCNPKICGTRDKMKRYNERKRESRIKK